MNGSGSLLTFNLFAQEVGMDVKGIADGCLG